MTPSEKEALRKEFNEYFWFDGSLRTDETRLLVHFDKNTAFNFLVSKLEEKEKVLNEYLFFWNQVDEFVRNHPSTKIGESVSKRALEMLQQSEAKLEAARNFIRSQHLTSEWEKFYDTFKSLDK